jgi:beta-N-acetylhexosaminidase
MGMNRAGMRAVGKHFPGHGSVSADSHLELPSDKREMEEMIAQDLLPFSKLSKTVLDGIMTAHIAFNKIDKLPVTFSSFWLQKILREQIGFTGVIFSDDLSMAGAEKIGDYPERAKKALDAGCDMILICNNHDGVMAVLDQLDDYHCSQSQKRLLKMCGHFQLTRAELTQSLLWRETVLEIKRLTANSITS